jgi:AcrR family transcriptional regulator
MSGKQVSRAESVQETRRRLLDSADALFYEGGIRATGVEVLAKRAGVTKMTLYSHFASKDDLVVAYLERRDRRWQESLKRTLEGQTDPKEKLLSVFDAYRELLVSGSFRGCAYVNCAAEFPDREHPVREAVRRHKSGLRRRLAKLATEAGCADPEGLAENLFLLLEGSYVTGALEGDGELVLRARAVAAGFVETAVAAGGRRDV